MCGITGIYSPSGSVDPLLLRRMRETLVHRGPDDAGLYIGEQAGLAFRRLSVIDLVTGNQPISNETKDVWTVFNGEIYNYRELREELRVAGHRFDTSSDTECIVHGYEEWGDAMFERLNGMFAIAIWDEGRRRLLLARDRAGEKPLYYWWNGTDLVFGSELKALMLHPRVDRSMDWTAFDEYCTFGFIAAPRSIFGGVSKLPAGHYMAVDAGGAKVQSYWRLDITRRFAGSYADAQAECFRLLDDAVRLRMVSDVPLGAFLSGGLDSSAVVACMARHSSGPVKTFSIGFDQAQHDETAYAQLVAAHHGTDNIKLVVTPRYVDKVERILLNFDEPFADSSALPTYLVSELTKQHVTVALSGDGGDELFGGYPTYRMMLRLARILNWVPEPLRLWLSELRRAFPVGSRLQRRLRLVGMSENERFVRLISLIKAEDRLALYTKKARLAIGEAGAAARQKAEAMDAHVVDYVTRMQWADFRSYLPDDILVKVDRTSMQVSLETRAPFLDHRLIEFVFSLPGAWKVSASRSKGILRDALAGHVPQPILDRGKMGFSVPLQQWLAGDLFEFCRERVLSDPMREIFNERIVARWLGEHREARRDHSPKLWTLLCFALWLNKHAYAL